MGQYDEFIRPLVDADQKRANLTRSLATYSASNPDEYAKAVSLGKTTGIAPELLIQDAEIRQSAESIKRMRAFDIDSLVRTNPKTAAFLTDPQNASLAHDDVDNLGFFETLWNSTKRGFPALKSILPAINVMNQSAGLAQFDYVDEALAKGETPDESKLGAVASQYAQMTPEQRAIFRETAAKNAEKTVSRSARRLARLQEERNAIPLPGVVNRTMATETFGEAFREIGSDPLKFIAAIGPESLIQSAPGLLAAIPAGIAGGPMGVAGSVGANSFLVDYANSVVEGLSRAGVDVTDSESIRAALRDPAIISQVAEAAGKRAAVVGAVDAVSGGVAGKMLLPSKIAGKMVARPIATEMANIALQLPVQAGLGAAGEAGGQLAAGQELQPGEILAEAFGEFFGTPAEVVSASAKRYANLYRTQQDQAFFDALAKGVTDSKLHQRLPEKTKEFIASLREEGGPQNVYVDAKQAMAYFQSAGMDALAVAEEVTGDARQLQEAAALGGDWVIPVEDFAAKLAGTEHLKGLREDMRLREGDLSPRELAASEADQAQREAQIAAMVERAQRQIEADSAAQTIYQDIYGQAINTGATPTTAQAWAAITAANYRTRAARLGMDAKQLWEEEGLTVTRPLPDVLANRKNAEPQLDSRLDMLRSGTGPRDGELFGPSILEFLRERGGLQDMGGELSSRDANAGRRPFQKNIIQPDGLIFDSARELLAEAGYPVGDTEASFLEMLDQELRGNPVYAPGMANSEAQSLADELRQIAEALEQMGIDLSTLTNEQVRGLLDEAMQLEGEAFNQFAGQSAATADKHALATAQQRLAAGDNAETVRKETGWFKGADGKWRYEISDKDAKLKKPFPENGALWGDIHTSVFKQRAQAGQIGITLGDMLDHPALFAAYPQLSELSISTKPGDGASFLVGSAISPRSIEIGERVPMYEVASVLLHEIQHDIQSIEGFATGGNKSVKSLSPENLSRYNDLLGKADDARDTGRRGEAFEYDRQARQVLAENYQALAGEVEARNTQARQNMTAEQRRATPPSATADVADQDVIIVFNGKEMANAPTPANADAADKRGAYYPGSSTIALLEKANLSTFLHELGHHWLEGLRRDALRDNAPQQVKDDWAKTAKWLGINPAAPIPESAHEQWARGTETYFGEGKAPAFELRELFRKFSAWVKSVYRDLSRLNVTLSDEVRGVMDRLIATDEEIAQAEQLQNLELIFPDAKSAGITDAEWLALQALREKARSTAEQQAVAKVMRELKRENTAWWKAALDSMRGEVTKEAQQVPVYQALHVLTHGSFFDGTVPESPIKLSREALVAMYGEPYLKRLSAQTLRTHGWIYSRTGGMHPDAVAPLFGFDSGDALVKSIVEAAPIKQWIEAETKRRMLEAYGDMLNDGGLADEAMSAVHNDQQADVLMEELRILNRKAGRGEITQKALFKDAARREIGRRRIEAIDPNYYLRAERRAGKEAFEAAARQDFKAAAEAKQRQLLNLEFYRAARDGREEAEKAVAHLKDLTKSRARARIGKAGQEWLDQLDGILERYSFAPMSVSNRARSLAEWYASINDPEGLNAQVSIAPSVLDEARRVNYRELPLDDLLAVADSVRSIEHVARKITEVMRNGKAFEMEEIISEVEETVENSTLPEREMLRPGDEPSLSEQFKNLTYTMLRPEKIFELLDDGTSGIFHDILWNRAAAAQVVHDDLKQKIMLPLQAFMEDVGPEQKERMALPHYINGLGRSLKLYELIGIAMNVGNAGNLDKLKRGGISFADGSGTPINDQLLSELLDPLSAEDWKMIQAVWDTIGQLYPQLNDLNQRVTGLPLPKVEPMPVVTKHGTFPGGYWPAVGDPDYSQVGKQQDEAGARAADIFPSPYPNAATAHSFRKERTNAAYPLLFDWRKILSRHVNQVTVDIAYAEFVAEANRLLNNNRVQLALMSKLGREQYQGLRDWLKRQVAAAMGGFNGAKSVDGVMNMAVANAAVAALGYKVATALGNLVVAPIQAMHQVKGRYMAQGYWEYMQDPKAALAKVQAMSGEMRHRGEHLDATFNQVLDMLAGKPSVRKVIMQHAMMIHMVADRIGTTGIWLGKYYQEFEQLSANAKDEHDLAEAEAGARRLADKTIRTTQTAGAPKDLSSFERDPKYAWARMFLGPMIIMQNEMRGTLITKRNVAMTLLATWILPSVMFELAVGRGPDDDEDWKAWALRKMAIYPMQMVPLVRDAASAIESLFTHKPSVTRANPITDMGLQMVKAAQKLMSDNADAGDKVAASLQAIGVATGLPGYASGTVANYLTDLATGETQINSPLDVRFLFIKRDSDRRD
jgi:hypothetical protein